MLAGELSLLMVSDDPQAGHVSWFHVRLRIAHYRCPLCFLFLGVTDKGGGTY